MNLGNGPESLGVAALHSALLGEGPDSTKKAKIDVSDKSAAAEPESSQGFAALQEDGEPPSSSSVCHGGGKPAVIAEALHPSIKANAKGQPSLRYALFLVFVRACAKYMFILIYIYIYMHDYVMDFIGVCRRWSCHFNVSHVACLPGTP